MNRPNRSGILHQNNFWLGILIGACIPIASYGILLTVFDAIDQNFLPPDVNLSRGFRERTLSVIAICCNLIPFHLYKRNYCDNTMRGIILPTLAFVVWWVVLFGQLILGLN